MNWFDVVNVKSMKGKQSCIWWFSFSLGFLDMAVFLGGETIPRYGGHCLQVCYSLLPWGRIKERKYGRKHNFIFLEHLPTHHWQLIVWWNKAIRTPMLKILIQLFSPCLFLPIKTAEIYEAWGPAYCLNLKTRWTRVWHIHGPPWCYL